MAYTAAQSTQVELTPMNPQPYAQSHQSVPSYYPGQQSIQQPYAQNGTPSANSLSPQVIKEDGDILWPRLPDPKNFKETRLVDDFVNDNKHDPFYMFRISHRDANSLLSVRLDSHRLEVLPQEYRKLIAKPGAMVAMSPSITLRGTVSFSFMKLFTRGEFAKSTYTIGYGDGIVELAPTILGDVIAIPVHPTAQKGACKEWKVGKNAFLAAAGAVDNDYKAQSLTKAMFSGEGLFVYTFFGFGWLFVQGFGAIVRKDLVENEQWIIDNHHLVAWNCSYTIERVASGGIISGISSHEGLVCKFTGPGNIYYHTRKLPEFAAHLKKAGR